ncbi:MAG TPA: M24 family metallopeptidase [Acidimicrobiales bacterium]|nr:M24 family metallopeptidase [Acidimicrobiales bacterium]
MTLPSTTDDVRTFPGAGAASSPTLVEAVAKRQRRLLEAAKLSGRGAVVIYSGAEHSLLATDGVCWASGFKPMGECALGIGPDGSFELWVSPQWDLSRAQEAVGEHATSVTDVFVAAQSWLQRMGVSRDEVLLCGTDKISARRHPSAVAALGEHDGTGDRLLLEIARWRDEYERDLALKATQIAEVGYQRLLEELHPGLGEFAVVAILDGILRELGSEDNFVLISASQRNRSVHPPTDRMVERGDLLLAEISPSVGGMFTQICRSVTIGRAGPGVVDDYQLLDAAFEAGRGACVPGGPVRGAAEAMNAVLTEAGFGDYCRPPYMRARGHGLGIGSVLPGDVTVSSNENFAEGDFFVLHPNQYLPGSGYLLCGEPVIVETGGARLMSSRRGELATVGVT